MDEEILSRIRDALKAHERAIACAYLFGSRARGDFRPDSDLDVAVLFDETPPATLNGLGLDLAAALEESIRTKVDLVVLNRAPPDLVHRILRDATLVFEANRSARVQFEVRTRAEYFDLLPYLQEYRRHRPEQGRDGS